MIHTKLFEPRSVAIIGASTNPAKVGYAVLNNMLSAGFKGGVYPVNLHEKKILENIAYSSVLEIPRPVDLSVIAVPAEFVPQVLEESGKKKIPYSIIISSGFQELGTEEGKQRDEKIQAIAHKYSIRIVGPNCLGIVNTAVSMNASFAGDGPEAGSVSLISQSGAMVVSLIDWSKAHRLGLRMLVSLGNKSDISELDALEYLARDPGTSVIGMYLEGIKNIPKFLNIVQSLSKKKPVVVLQPGGSKITRNAMASHTGSLTSSHSIVSAVLKQAGALEVSDLEDFFHLLRLYTLQGKNPSRDVVVFSNAGGPAIIAVDAIAKTELALVPLSPAVRQSLKKVLPEGANVANPVDVLGDADMDRFKRALAVLSREKHLGNVCILITPQAATPLEELARYLVALQKKVSWQIVACFIGGIRVRAAREILSTHGIASFGYPADAIRILNTSKFIFREREPRISISEKPRAVVTPRPLRYAAVQKILTKEGFPLVKGTIISPLSPLPARVRYPVAMKLLAEDVIHKKQSGGVALNVGNEHTAKRVMKELMSTGKRRKGKFEGVLVQSMQEPGAEFIMGIKRDAAAGPVIMVGIGGVFAESFARTSFRLLPIARLQARHMLEELNLASLLERIDQNFLESLLVKLSAFAVKHPEVLELDFNPVTVYTKGGMILDARIFVT